jgi:phage gp29-like protein
MAKGIWINDRDFISFSDSKKTSLFQEIATRSGSIDFYSLGMYLPDPDPVLKKMGKDQKVYRELTTDARVGANIASRKAGVLSMEWGIDRGKAKSREAKVIEGVFKRLKVNRILSEILDAAHFGYQPIEVLWENVGGLILPKNVVAKPREWFRFSAENELLLCTKAAPNGIPVPGKKFLCPVYNGSYENPYGERTLSRVFWPVTFKKGGLKFWVNFVERFGTPWIVGKLPRGTDKPKINDLADMLESMVTDAVAVIPDDSSVEIIEAAGKGASSDLHRALVEWCNSEVSTAILGHAGASESTPGKLGGDNTAGDVKQELVDADANVAIETMDTLIGWIHELNFGGSEPPTFSMWQEEDVDLDLATRDQTLTETGVRFSKKYFTKTYGFEDEDIEEISVPSSGSGGLTPSAPQPPASFSEGHRCAHCSGIHFADAGKTSAAPQSFGLPAPSPADDYTDRAGAESVALMDGMIEPVRRLVMEAKSLEEIRDGLIDLYEDIRPAELGELIARAITTAELAGRFEVKIAR